MPLTTRVWSAGKLLLVAGMLLLTYVLFAAAAMRVALKTRQVGVPDLAGKTVNEAYAALPRPVSTWKSEEDAKWKQRAPPARFRARDRHRGARPAGSAA